MNRYIITIILINLQFLPVMAMESALLSPRVQQLDDFTTFIKNIESDLERIYSEKLSRKQQKFLQLTDAERSKISASQFHGNETNAALKEIERLEEQKRLWERRHKKVKIVADLVGWACKEYMKLERKRQNDLVEVDKGPEEDLELTREGLVESIVRNLRDMYEDERLEEQNEVDRLLSKQQRIVAVHPSNFSSSEQKKQALEEIRLLNQRKLDVDQYWYSRATNVQKVVFDACHKVGLSQVQHVFAEGKAKHLAQDALNIANGVAKIVSFVEGQVEKLLLKYDSDRLDSERTYRNQFNNLDTSINVSSILYDDARGALEQMYLNKLKDLATKTNMSSIIDMLALQQTYQDELQKLDTIHNTLLVKENRKAAIDKRDRLAEEKARTDAFLDHLVSTVISIAYDICFFDAQYDVGAESVEQVSVPPSQSPDEEAGSVEQMSAPPSRSPDVGAESVEQMSVSPSRSPDVGAEYVEPMLIQPPGRERREMRKIVFHSALPKK